MHEYCVVIFLVLLFKRLALNDGTPWRLIAVPLLIDFAMFSWLFAHHHEIRVEKYIVDGEEEQQRKEE